MPSVSEGAGSVIMTVNVLNGTLARSVSVFISYASESQFMCQICFKDIKTTSYTHVCNYCSRDLPVYHSSQLLLTCSSEY